MSQVIAGLVSKSYTKKQVYELLKERFDIRVSYGAFRSYLYQTERERRAKESTRE
ncbi:MAG: hypothetical protein K2H64_05305 [Desulfovibrio sp.]|nr:hypothetical protein [Desulfovibrio sp.]